MLLLYSPITGYQTNLAPILSAGWQPIQWKKLSALEQLGPGLHVYVYGMHKTNKI